MALPTNIHTLLSGNVVEWARIEFKETWQPEASLKTITAFANDLDNWGGGYIILGVEDDGHGRPKRPVKGLDVSDVDNIMKDILNKCKLISPDYLPIVEPVDYDNYAKLIVIWCPGGPVRPYHSPLRIYYESGKARESKETICWIRKMASTIKPSDQELTELYSLANHVPFDDQICHAADMTDLNITLIKAYLKEVGSDLFAEADRMDFNQLCIAMGISNSMPEYMKPKNVGLLFFSMNPEKFMPCAQIDVVEFPDGVGGDRIIENIFKGPLHQQLWDALRYIRNNVIQEKIIKHPDRAEADRFFNYPYPAIEEALANAVYHKGYNVREPIEVRVEPDRIQILSYPGPDRSVTVEALQSYHVVGRRYRNRRIGDYLKELHLTEGRNTGFRKILRALENNGSPLPEFITDEDHSYFATIIHIHKKFSEESENHGVSGKQPEKQLENPEIAGKQLEKQPENPEISGKQPEKQPENPEISEKQLEKSNLTKKEELENRTRKILSIIRLMPSISQKKLAKELGLTEMEVRTVLNYLKADGTLFHEGPDKGGRWVINEDNVIDG